MTLARDIGLYVHVPFCRQRCHFCAFYLEIARAERIDAFRSALTREIHLYRTQELLVERPLWSIYFGGGTPTALPPDTLVALLGLIRATWPSNASMEVTVEAHPSTVTAEALGVLAGAGFNRISFGAESMDERDFGPIGRPGTVQDTQAAMTAARTAGFTNINLDLMYGLPGQSLESWVTTLQSLLTLEPVHVSCYALTIEEGTKLAHGMARGAIPFPDEALQIEMERAAEEILMTAGFERYEISNYAKPGFACRHNLLYWTDRDYLGLGPSAHSYVNGVRFGNVADLDIYITQLKTDILPLSERTSLSATEQRRDALVFGLRLLKGVPTSLLDSAVPGQEGRKILGNLTAKGLLTTENDRIRLTRLGRHYADTVAGELF